MDGKCYNKQHNVILPIKTPGCLERGKRRQRGLGCTRSYQRLWHNTPQADRGERDKRHTCMSFKHAKCQSLVLNSGRILNKFHFRVVEDDILSFREKPVKRLRKVFSCCLKDTNSIKVTNSYMEGWLRTVDKSRLPRKLLASESHYRWRHDPLLKSMLRQ